MNITKTFTPDKLISPEEARRISGEHDQIRISHDLGIVDEAIRIKCKEGLYDAYIDITMFYCYDKLKDILREKGYEVTPFGNNVLGSNYPEVALHICWGKSNKHTEVKTKWSIFRRRKK